MVDRREDGRDPNALGRTLAAKNAQARVTLVGYSLGAVLAAHYAARHPEQVKALVLIGTPVFDTPAEGRNRIRGLSPLAALFSLHPFLARESCQLVCALRPLARRLTVKARSDLPAEVAEDSVLHNWESFEGTMRHVLLGAPIATAIADLRRTHIRVTFIQGTHDKVTDLSRLRELARQSGYRLITCESGHEDYLDACETAILTEVTTSAID